MAYMIQSHGTTPGAADWDEDYVGNDVAANTFDTEAEAWAAVESLRAIGDDWAQADYRVVARS